ncbi:MAG: hypothetical protein COU63_03270 [Candidatus Pacebacteria bacterium CG10_big_fil_rev_8_21_14_0_10_36_11]|nr:hypothetical protein [Candidatus Pacearchaeota archaeon]OIP74445.1 MAG: hypothetical protein AUK08_01520 [Candidatus Pacebacteria bacterium CG2_30_36_39]PIR65009.1 MAG: hypothetical protein COU63_03270 [Candidatus Pacebacteria bacterium CG10_big_fil_rev_8_21_14_0_10_36_11]PJC42963.1 MAG: hypothetical protein CO040_01675 [Candidatus Pacebacteria bacterium CG_4_9_14_0_2_um_filter_36_8]
MGFKEKRTPSRTDLEKFTDDEIVNRFGLLHLLISLTKSQKRHDSDRHIRRIERSEKAEKKKGTGKEE